MDPDFHKRMRKNRLYDKMHRGFVNTCIGFTAITTFFLGYKIYEYFRYIRPLHLTQSKLAEDELLLEGRNIEEPVDIKLS